MSYKKLKIVDITDKKCAAEVIRQTNLLNDLGDTFNSSPTASERMWAGCYTLEEVLVYSKTSE